MERGTDQAEELQADRQAPLWANALALKVASKSGWGIAGGKASVELVILAAPWNFVAIHLAGPSQLQRQPLPDNHCVLQPDNTLLLFEFSDAAIVRDWVPIDDRVMGGVSRSRLRHDPAGHAVFEGTVSLERNGGFASVRTQATDLGVKGASAYVLKVNSDGKRYKFNLRMEDSFDGVTYQAAFVTPAGAWTTLHLPLLQFAATFRGRAVPDAPSLDPARVRQAGFLIADRQMGNFSLKVQAIGTV